VKTGTFIVRLGDDSHRVAVSAGGRVHVDAAEPPLEVTPEAPSVYRVDDGTRARRVFVAGTGEARQVFVDGEAYELCAGPEAVGRRRASRAAHDLLEAPMPARVTAILVEPGQAVRRGDVLLKLEAMKMELAVRAPRDGSVTSVSCRVGELVQPGVGLLELS
jgi:3-methylcrotonyl-CoA carboxylase alpha subunit